MWAGKTASMISAILTGAIGGSCIIAGFFMDMDEGNSKSRRYYNRRRFTYD